MFTIKNEKGFYFILFNDERVSPPFLSKDEAERKMDRLIHKKFLKFIRHS